MEAEAMNDILHSLTNTAIDDCKEHQFKVITRTVLYFDFKGVSLEAQIFMDLYIIRESYGTHQSVVQCIKLFDRIFNGYWNEMQWCLSGFAWIPSIHETCLNQSAFDFMSFNDVHVCNELSQWVDLIPRINFHHLLLLISTLISSLFASVDVWVIDHYMCECFKHFVINLNMQHEYNELNALKKILLPTDTKVKQLQEYFSIQSPLGKNLIQRAKSITLEPSHPWYTVAVATLISSPPPEPK